MGTRMLKYGSSLLYVYLFMMSVHGTNAVTSPCETHTSKMVRLGGKSGARSASMPDSRTWLG